jgi:hypothetical protein
MKSRLQVQSHEYACKFRTVQFRIAEVQFGYEDLDNEIRTGRPPLDAFQGKILAILDNPPFKSSRSIVKRLLIVYSVVLRHLYEFLGFKSFHLHLVPHLLTGHLREARNEYARAMLPFLHTVKRDG